MLFIVHHKWLVMILFSKIINSFIFLTKYFVNCYLLFTINILWTHPQMTQSTCSLQVTAPQIAHIHHNAPHLKRELLLEVFLMRMGNLSCLPLAYISHDFSGVTIFGIPCSIFFELRFPKLMKFICPDILCQSSLSPSALLALRHWVSDVATFIFNVPFLPSSDCIINF